jgi:hypothetical protein
MPDPLAVDAIPVPPCDGVYGPMYVVNAIDGRCSVASPPLTNAFLVWVGFPVLVVSAGVARADWAAAAARIRTDLAAPDLAIVFASASVDLTRPTVHVDAPLRHSVVDLARAEALVILQCTFLETDAIDVDVDGVLVGLACDHEVLSDGGWWPRVRPRSPGAP